MSNEDDRDCEPTNIYNYSLISDVGWRVILVVAIVVVAVQASTGRLW